MPFSCTDCDFDSVRYAFKDIGVYRPYNGINIEQTLIDYWLDFLIDKQANTVPRYQVFYWLIRVCSINFGKKLTTKAINQ